MNAEPSSGTPEAWRRVHRALSDPVRIQIFEELWHGPRSAKELAVAAGLAPDRLYYHLRLLEQAGIIEVGEYRPLPSGQVERVYRRAEAEPPGDASSPEEVATFLCSVLDATKADITAAFMAKAAGERREVAVAQGPLWLTDEGLAELQRYLRDLEARFRAPQSGGTPTRVLVAMVDLEERPPAPGGEPEETDTAH